MLETFHRPPQTETDCQPPSRLNFLQTFRSHQPSDSFISQYRPTFELNVETIGSRGGYYV